LIQKKREEIEKLNKQKLEETVKRNMEKLKLEVLAGFEQCWEG